GVNRSFVPEKEEGSFDGLLLAPMDRGAIYLGKLLGNLTLIGLVELLSLPLFALFLNIPIFDYLPGLLLVFALGTVGFASIGTLFAAMAVNSRMREVMLPILLFPLASPILIAAVETTGIVFRSGEWDELSSWISLLATFMIVFFVASLLLFEYILEE
ncbi:MAG: cytochrome C biogenesis protein, partial [Candidatus Latescibacteria bacterium]|nr:cytochrome C biogenesis protein [Candidatus Latescibacterota bacterium]